MDKQRIIHISSTGLMDNETILENILNSEIDEEMLSAKSQESLNLALGNLNNPFQKLPETILIKVNRFYKLEIILAHYIYPN